jgi:CRISPR type I-E-associated protein CasB/Cse2
MSTSEYINTLTSLQKGDLGLLRTHAGRGIDHSPQAFDLFAGLWWPLRQKSQRAPRREVAWLVAKLYAAYPLPHIKDAHLPQQLARCQPPPGPERQRFRQRFDNLLLQPIKTIEEPLRWALRRIYENKLGIDWVKLTDDLSIWQRESKRRAWAEQFLGKKNTEGEDDAD